jgi:hypothetical protein
MFSFLLAQTANSGMYQINLQIIEETEGTERERQGELRPAATKE